MAVRNDSLDEISISEIDKLLSTLWLYAVIVVTVLVLQVTVAIYLTDDETPPCPSHQERGEAGILIPYDTQSVTGC